MQLKSKDEKYTVYFRDASNMPELADNSINLIVTSPPYGLNRQYGDSEGQIESIITSFGDYDHYISLLNKVWDECWRVLEPGGYAAINVANTHADKKFFGESFEFNNSYELLRKWFSLGAFYKGTYYWQCTRAAKRYMGSFPYPLGGVIIRETELICIFRKPRDGAKLSAERDERRKKSTMTVEEYRECFTEAWDFNGAKVEKHDEVVHLAPFPIELPMRLIRGYSVIDDVVLDPFLGTGTTMLAAKKLGRKCVGYEVEERFSSIIQEKTGIFTQSLKV